MDYPTFLTFGAEVDQRRGTLFAPKSFHSGLTKTKQGNS
jgi:hypothetical protein